ncbi:MAG: molecular chaperone DnaJ [Cyanobacteria bacterium J055]|nr:MAG: molecular chaperone DnaJ [Cyanobacteria bacterium J055]
MQQSDHYETLKVKVTATQAEIKQAYRRLVKEHHPDCRPDLFGHEQIARINAAYEVLGDRESRTSYDRQRDLHSQPPTPPTPRRSRSQRPTGARADEQIERWLRQVYAPIDRSLLRILRPLNDRLDDLAADPFDDELMEAFCDYLRECRTFLQQAQQVFRSLPNPPTLAGVAADLYYCLNQLGDGIEALESFSLNYDDRHLNTGRELFRIAARLRREAKLAINV